MAESPPQLVGKAGSVLHYLTLKEALIESSQGQGITVNRRGYGRKLNVENAEFPPDAFARRTRTAAQASLPFAIVQQWGVPCGYERSFKMLPGRLLANRYLLGVTVGDVTSDQWLDACRRLDMPEAYLNSFAARMADANLVFLGFEDNEVSCTYKVYLEFWEKVKEEVRRKQNPKEPILLHLGFKWDADDSRRKAISEYLCFPLLDKREILKRIADIYAVQPHSTCGQIVDGLVELAATRCGDGAFKYLEVREEDSLRVSFDLNLYAAQIRLQEIWPLLSTTGQHYAIPVEPFARLYDLVGDKLFGHLSGGIDRRGEGFFTVYYQV
jgi:hypothetical protein